MGAKRIGHNRVNPVAPHQECKKHRLNLLPTEISPLPQNIRESTTQDFQSRANRQQCQTTARPAQDIKEAK
jgi:hypothetical protein